jgi:divalent metal cation (Fe/Co/Zn/Cd) transporter
MADEETSETILIALAQGSPSRWAQGLPALAKAAAAIVTGSPATAAEAALILVGISLNLVRRNDDFLVGKTISAADRDRVHTFVPDYPGVGDVDELLITYIGPEQLWVIARVKVADNLTGGQVRHLVRGLEADLSAQSHFFYRVDVVPDGGGWAVTT